MFKYTSIFLIALCATFAGCKQKLDSVSVNGLWRAELFLDQDGAKLPFFIEFIISEEKIKACIYNGSESIVHDDVKWRNDSIVISNPYFNSQIVAFVKQNKMVGYWIDHSRSGSYKIPFEAKYNLPHRFAFDEMPSNSVDGTWQAIFSPGTEGAYPAIGLFRTNEHSTEGTFLTETGDYRFLEGGFGGGHLKLSGFDGAHAFLFDAQLTKDTLRGWFYSGKHHKEPFIAWRNDSAKLKDPYTLTHLSSPNAKVAFKGTGLDGVEIHYPSEMFMNKALIIQIMGSWCPNCLDESAFLSSIYNDYADKGLEIIALAFERQELESVIPVLQKLKMNIGMPYPILYAGKASKDSSAKVLPFLDAIKSYPTTIFIKPGGEIFRIHSGFYGPGTGNYFEKQSKEMRNDIETLLQLSFPTRITG